MAIRRPGTTTAPATPATAAKPATPATAAKPAAATTTAATQKPAPAAATTAVAKPPAEVPPPATEPPTENDMVVVTDGQETGLTLPPHLAKYENDRRGKENITTEDVGTPRILLLQPTSDAVQGVGKGEGKGAVNGYAAGNLYFPPLDRLLGDSLTFVVLVHNKEWVRFGDRLKNEDPGLHWKMLPEEVDKFPERRKDLEWGPNRTPPAAQYTHNFLILAQNADTSKLDFTMGPAVLSLAKTGMPCAQVLCQSLLTSKGPAFIRKYTARSRQVKNNKGTFYVLDVVPAGFTDEKETEALEALYTRLSGKPLNVDYSEGEEAAASTDAPVTAGGDGF